MSRLSISQRIYGVSGAIALILLLAGFLGAGFTVSLLVAGLLSIVLLLWLASSVGASIKLLTQSVQQQSLQQLSVGSGELAELAEVIQCYQQQNQDDSAQLAEQVEMLEASSEMIDALTSNMDQSAQMQRSSMDKVNSDMAGLAQSVESEALQVASAAMAAQEATEETTRGNQEVTDTIDGIERLAADVTAVSEAINQLDEDSKNIGSVLDVIRGIAEQTNLLALNAAIEAARAGESGRGFAVVADEVRTLASRTQESTEEIQATIERLQQGAQRAVKSIECGQAQVGATVEQAGKAGEALSSIATSVAAILDITHTIHGATDEQTAFVKSVMGNVEIVNEQAVDTAGRAGKAAEAAHQLAELAGSLRARIS